VDVLGIETRHEFDGSLTAHAALLVVDDFHFWKFLVLVDDFHF
jgi:hypothetical protein